MMSFKQIILFASLLAPSVHVNAKDSVAVMFDYKETSTECSKAEFAALNNVSRKVGMAGGYMGGMERANWHANNAVAAEVNGKGNSDMTPSHPRRNDGGNRELAMQSRTLQQCTTYETVWYCCQVLNLASYCNICTWCDCEYQDPETSPAFCCNYPYNTAHCCPCGSDDRRFLHEEEGPSPQLTRELEETLKAVAQKECEDSKIDCVDCGTAMVYEYDEE